MANLVTIEPLILGAEGYVVPTPSEYIANTSTIVDSARNVDGYMCGSVVRNDVAKISMKWAFISPDDWAELLQQFEPAYGGYFTRNVTFFNQTSNSLETREMYVSDRNSSGSFLLYNANDAPSPEMIGLPRGFLDASLSLIEV